MTNVTLGKEEEPATNTETERKKAEWLGIVFTLAGMDSVHTFSMRRFGPKITVKVMVKLQSK